MGGWVGVRARARVWGANIGEIIAARDRSSSESVLRDYFFFCCCTNEIIRACFLLCFFLLLFLFLFLVVFSCF